MHSVCQSCGMPSSRDPGGGGTECDGSRSTHYCSHCYQKGAFTQPHLTLEEMRELVIAKLVSLHFPMPLAKLMTRNLAQLERWKHPRNP